MVGPVGPPWSPAHSFINLDSNHQSSMTETMYLPKPLSAMCIILITLFNKFLVCVCVSVCIGLIYCSVVFQLSDHILLAFLYWEHCIFRMHFFKQ